MGAVAPTCRGAVGTDATAEEAARRDLEEEGGRRKVKDLQFGKFLEAFAAPPFPKFVAQLEIVLQPEQEARLLEQFGLDPRRVKFGPARPDLLEVLPPAAEGADHPHG